MTIKGMSIRDVRLRTSSSLSSSSSSPPAPPPLSAPPPHALCVARRGADACSPPAVIARRAGAPTPARPHVGDAAATEVCANKHSYLSRMRRLEARPSEPHTSLSPSYHYQAHPALTVICSSERDMSVYWHKRKEKRCSGARHPRRARQARVRFVLP